MPLKPKTQKFITAKANGESNRKAGLIAGAKTIAGADAYANRMLKNVEVQQAIAHALEYHNATPEFAVGRLKSIATQNKELGASRLASKDILELHGWSKTATPSIQLSIKQAFFKQSREHIDQEPQPAE